LTLGVLCILLFISYLINFGKEKLNQLSRIKILLLEFVYLLLYISWILILEKDVMVRLGVFLINLFGIYLMILIVKELKSKENNIRYQDNV
jgi:hypothetical protein